MNAPLGLVSFCLLLSFGTAAAIERQIDALPLDSQTVEYKGGIPSITSLGANTVVILSVRPESKSKATAWISIFNRGESPVTVFDDAFRASVEGKDLSILGAAELERKEKRRRFWENVGAGLAAGANSYSAAQSGSSTSYSYQSGQANAYTRNGPVRIDYQGTSTTKTYDSEANQRAIAAANDRNAEMIDRIRSNQSARSEALSGVLQTQTINPDQLYTGFVQLKLPTISRNRSTMIEASVTVDRDIHHFYLFLDGQPDESQRRSVGLSANSTWTANLGRNSSTDRQINARTEALAQPSVNVEAPWTEEAAQTVASNCLSQLIAGREVDDYGRSRLNFVCICMTEKLRSEVTFGALIAASEKSPEQQRSEDVNVRMRQDLRACADEYFVELK